TQEIILAPTQFGLFRPISELPLKQCKLDPEIVRNLAIAIYTNNIKYIIDKFLDFDKQKMDQFFHLFIIYNQLGDKLIDQFNCPALKKSKLSGHPLYLAQKLKYKELSDYFVKQIN